MSQTPSNELVPQEKQSESQDEGNTAGRKSSFEVLRDYGFEVGEGKESLLGKGSFSEVRKATYKTQEIAVKVIKRAGLSTNFLTKCLPREIEVLSKINHENLIKVYHIFKCTNTVYIFMELAHKRMLDYIRDHVCLAEQEARHFFRQIVSAVKHLHSMNVAHRDLKCENVMITKNNKIKIIDFGFCRTTVNSRGGCILSETFCGSHAYMAPEVLRRIPYDPAMYDVWSLGCVLFKMVTGRLPFDDRNVKKMVTDQLNKAIEYPSDVELTVEVKNLIESMLEPVVTERISMDGVSQSAWLKLKDSVHPCQDKDAESKEGRHQKHYTKSQADDSDIF